MPISSKAQVNNFLNNEGKIIKTFGGPGWTRTNRAVKHLIYSQDRYLLRDTDPYLIGSPGGIWTHIR